MILKKNQNYQNKTERVKTPPGMAHLRGLAHGLAKAGLRVGLFFKKV